MKKIEFINVRKIAKENPDNFLLFDKGEFENLKPNDLVKVGLNQERFWIKFVKFENNQIVGIVNNILIRNNDLKENDTVLFSKDCVTDIYYHELNELTHNGKNSIKINEEIQIRMKFVSNNIGLLHSTCNEPFFLNLYNKYK